MQTKHCTRLYILIYQNRLIPLLYSYDDNKHTITIEYMNSEIARVRIKEREKKKKIVLHNKCIHIAVLLLLLWLLWSGLLMYNNNKSVFVCVWRYIYSACVTYVLFCDYLFMFMFYSSILSPQLYILYPTSNRLIVVL